MTPYYASPDGTAVLYHDDALEVLRQLPTASVDAVVTDPPYSSGGLYRADRATASTGSKYTRLGANHHLPDFGGDNRDQRAYAYWSALWMAQALRVTKPGGILTCCTDWRQLPTTTDAVQAGGWVWRGVLPWIKPDARPQLGRFRQSAEFIVWATNGAREIVGDCLPGYWVATWSRARVHQTEKPLGVMRDLVKAAPPGGVVLDPFAGGGTTGIAALAEGRRFVGVEMSPEYAAVAADRLRQAGLQPRVDDPVDLLAGLPGVSR